MPVINIMIVWNADARVFYLIETVMGDTENDNAKTFPVNQENFGAALWDAAQYGITCLQDAARLTETEIMRGG